MEDQIPSTKSSESSAINLRNVIIVAILLCSVAIFSMLFLGNFAIAFLGLAAVIPLATVFFLAKNREKILDTGLESAEDKSKRHDA